MFTAVGMYLKQTLASGGVDNGFTLVRCVREEDFKFILSKSTTVVREKAAEPRAPDFLPTLPTPALMLRNARDRSSLYFQPETYGPISDRERYGSLYINSTYTPAAKMAFSSLFSRTALKQSDCIVINADELKRRHEKENERRKLFVNPDVQKFAEEKLKPKFDDAYVERLANTVFIDTKGIEFASDFDRVGIASAMNFSHRSFCFLPTRRELLSQGTHSGHRHSQQEKGRRSADSYTTEMKPHPGLASSRPGYTFLEDFGDIVLFRKGMKTKEKDRSTLSYNKYVADQLQLFRGPLTHSTDIGTMFPYVNPGNRSPWHGVTLVSGFFDIPFREHFITFRRDDPHKAAVKHSMATDEMMSGLPRRLHPPPSVLHVSSPLAERLRGSFLDPFTATEPPGYTVIDALQGLEGEEVKGRPEDALALRSVYQEFNEMPKLLEEMVPPVRSDVCELSEQYFDLVMSRGISGVQFVDRLETQPSEESETFPKSYKTIASAAAVDADIAAKFNKNFSRREGWWKRVAPRFIANEDLWYITEIETQQKCPKARAHRTALTEVRTGQKKPAEYYNRQQ